jgi:hypothetical protein
MASNIIAWLVPTARGSYADKAASMPENTLRSVPTAASPFLASHLPDLASSRPARAIQLAFDRPPRGRPGSFVLGADPARCDVVLPSRPGVAPRHCAVAFDAEARLVLHDFSDRGTQVWYDWDCIGDRADHSWLLSPGAGAGFPAAVRRVTIDIQGVRFQLVVNDHSANWDAYRARVDAFSAQPAALFDSCPSPGPLVSSPCSAAVGPVVPLLSAVPLFKHIFVKSLGEKPVGEFYVWNLARPWEPMVKATA